VRAGMFAVGDAHVQVIDTHSEDGGGWRDFDAAIRSEVAAGLPEAWYEQARTVQQEDRAKAVLEDAARSPEEYADTRVYRISGQGGKIDVSARLLTESFAPTARLLRIAVEAVTGTERPERVVIVGGLSWLPLATCAVADATGATPVMAGLDAAAQGALLFARGEVRLALPLGRQTVALPTHRIRDGLLEEVNVTLPWTEPFATLPDGTLTIDSEELELTVDGQPRAARLRGLVPGQHRIGIRPAWPGPGILVVRPVGGGAAHVVPLASLTSR
jgi:hypothetical protein